MQGTGSKQRTSSFISQIPDKKYFPLGADKEFIDTLLHEDPIYSVMQRNISSCSLLALYPFFMRPSSFLFFFFFPSTSTVSKWPWDQRDISATTCEKQGGGGGRNI